MLNLSSLNSEELKKTEVLQELAEQVGAVVSYYDEQEARQLASALRRILREQNLRLDAQVLGELKKWYNLTSYISLPAQSDEEVISLFQHGIKDILILDLESLIGRLETKLRVLPFTGPQEELCIKLIQALKHNRQAVGGFNIGEWLAIYTHAYPHIPLPSDFEAREFFNKNEKVGSLAMPEKELLAKLIQVYNFLKPFELWASYLKEGGGTAMSKEEISQLKLGMALKQTAQTAQPVPSASYQGARDLRDIKPKGGQAASSVSQPQSSADLTPAQNLSAPIPGTTQEIKLPPEAGARGPVLEPKGQEEDSISSIATKDLPPPSFQTAVPSKKEETVAPAPAERILESPLASPQQGLITIAELEGVAASKDLIAEQRIRKIIQHEFNTLSPEVRRYILNSPFWAE